MKKGYIPQNQRKKILLMCDDIRTHSGIGTVAKEIVLHTAHHFNYANLGAAIDLWDDRDIHFLAGMGIKFKSFPLLSLTGGISFTRMNQLNDDYEVGGSYEYLGFEELSRKSYGLGYYIGLNVNF